jgi:hypothetical protein
MPKDNQAVFLKSLPKNIAQVVTDVNEVMAALEHGQTLAENNQANKIGSQDRFLQILTDAEALGENIHNWFVKQTVGHLRCLTLLATQ